MATFWMRSLHYRTQAFDVVSPVIGAAQLILVDKRQGDLNEFRVLPMLI